MINRYVAIKPCLNHIAYDSKDADQLPATPVLGILQFTFHSGVNVSEPSQLASVLWRKSLTFVSTIPGFQRLYWAPVDHASPCQQIIVLMQWDSGRGWKLFQSSLGFSMMLGYIESISNRCIQLALPAYLFDFDSVLGLVSIQFSAMLSTTQVGKKPGFKTKWETTFAPYVNSATAEFELIYCCGEWLEADKFVDDRFFVALLFWKPDIQVRDQRRLREAIVHNLENHIAELVEDATNVVSVYTHKLNQVSSETFSLQLPGLLPVAVHFETNHPVFQTPVKPEYNVDEFTLSRGKDRLHLESMIQARQTPPERIAGGPAGSWCPMGIISQHHLPQRQGYSSTADMEMISFRAQIENPQIESLFEGLRRKLWELGDCLEGSQQQRQEIRAQLQQPIQEFSNGCGDAIQDISRRGIIGPSRFFGFRPNMEITIFDHSFEYAFSNYLTATHQQQFDQGLFSPWSALIPQGQGWITDYHSLSDQSEQIKTDQFIAFFSCQKEGAREEWYHDFAQRAQTEYDLLGHIFDWLRTLSKRITIQQLVVQKEDPWMTADRLEKANRPPPPLPPSIFDIPWANQLKKGHT
ncbi:hypothetical protein BGW36DRAFT_415267 [Talaromyces proteolyticus]|uniref:Uncharacterized protein n=1 Tax=Talaromyces proteolyticus TaxID=1131652 RepID=A0AAD4KYC8_9EURO|nr:uncharacterized protein BGW36DRAFT_415267 [Talaromyces proteolyticus]KAH8700095.1 hypothetical protein BGW36DRAFT_415267 [Talaromyces proteolyticus]